MYFGRRPIIIQTERERKRERDRQTDTETETEREMVPPPSVIAPRNVSLIRFVPTNITLEQNISEPFEFTG